MRKGVLAAVAVGGSLFLILLGAVVYLLWQSNQKSEPVGRAPLARRLLAGSLDRAVDVAATLELRG